MSFLGFEMGKPAFRWIKRIRSGEEAAKIVFGQARLGFRV